MQKSVVIGLVIAIVLLLAITCGYYYFNVMGKCSSRNPNKCNITCSVNDDCKEDCDICMNKNEYLQRPPNVGACLARTNKNCKCINNKCEKIS